MIDKNKSSKKPKSSPPTGNTNSLRLHNPGPLRSSNALRGEAWGAGGSRGAARHAAPSCRPGLPTQDAAREGPPRVAICPKEALECPRGEMTRDSTTPTPQKGQKGESRAPQQRPQRHQRAGARSSSAPPPKGQQRLPAPRARANGAQLGPAAPRLAATHCARPRTARGVAPARRAGNRETTGGTPPHASSPPQIPGREAQGGGQSNLS